jgi:multidrug transporter EmrE-like cation transporter
MDKGYRSWAERRDIIRAVIADTDPPALSTFQLSPSEEAYYRARSAKAVEALAQRSSSFKSYYALRRAKPFGYVIGISGLIVAGVVLAAAYLYLNHKDLTVVYPLFAACGTLAIAAIGWAVAGWITHRNTIRQNTNNMLFARFSQTTFTEALHYFHKEFGLDPDNRIHPEAISELRKGDDSRIRAANAVFYLLNYFEFLAVGVVHGDLDARIVRDNVRGLVVYYHDRCELIVRRANRANPKAYANLIKLRTHYREP